MIKFVFKKQIEKEEVNEKKYIVKNCIYFSEFVYQECRSQMYFLLSHSKKKKLRKRNKSYFI